MTHRLTVKTLKQETVTVEVPPTCTVDDCKEFLRAQRPDWRAGVMKLMCNGKQLTEGSLASAGVFEYLEGGSDRFIVALVTAHKPRSGSTAAPARVPPPTQPLPPTPQPSRSKCGGYETFLLAVAQRTRDTATSAEAKGRKQWAAVPAPPAATRDATLQQAAPTPTEDRLKRLPSSKF